MIQGLDKWLTTPPEEDESELFTCDRCGDDFETLTEYDLCESCQIVVDKDRDEMLKTYDSLRLL